MPFLPTLSTLFIVISAVLVAIGWWQIKQGKRETHKKTMIWAAISALLFFIIYMSRTVFIGNTPFGGPDHLKVYYTIFLVFHIILATTGAIFGIITLVLGFKENFAKHRKIGPVTSIIWFFTAITGIMVYLFLYILFDPGETTNLFQAIF